MPPKKRSRTASAPPPAPSTPDKKQTTTTTTEAAATSRTPQHASTEGKKPKTPKQDTVGSPSPAKGSHHQHQANHHHDAGRSSAKEKSGKKERSVSLSVTGKSLPPGDATPGRERSQTHSVPIRPMKLDLAEGVVDGEEGQRDGIHSSTVDDGDDAADFVPTNTVKDLEAVVLRSKVIAPDISGISCIAANRSETEVVVARENGSLVLYSVEYFQNIPHFTQLRSTGGRVRRTITRLAFLDLSAMADAASSASASSAPVKAHLRDRYFAASYLSGQIVLYDSETLFPVSVYQRTGGAVWDFTVVNSATIYAALADGSWHRLRVVLSRPTAAAGFTPSSAQHQLRPTLELERIVPRIAGADRAFAVAASAALGLVVGTDDAGNVHAWRHARSKSEASPAVAGAAAADGAVATQAGSLAVHETLWTCRLPKGMAMCCAIADGLSANTAASSIASPSTTAASSPAVLSRPVVAVGTSMGDVVFIDARHGHILHTFATHKGPVSTMTCDQGVLYASGWHESLRAFRCAPAVTGGEVTASTNGASAATAAVEGEWYPAEVKRRTHYHEASQLLVLPQRQLMLSASRDGTLMFSPLAQLFSAPAMYVNVTTQRFAFAAEKNVLLQTRLDRVEAFRMDARLRHWTPLFAHNIHGKFHLNGLWCDPRLRYIVFATDERVVLSRVGWRDGAEAALAISRIEEVLELPAGRGLLDAVFVNRQSVDSASTQGKKEAGEEEDEVSDDAVAAAAATDSTDGSLYLLFDSHVLDITLADGFPVIRTELTSGSAESASLAGAAAPTSAQSIRPQKLVHSAAAPGGATRETGGSLVVFGIHGLWRCELTVDGTPNPDTAQLVEGPTGAFSHVTVVPPLTGKSQQPPPRAGSGAAPSSSSPHRAATVVGLSVADGRYITDVAAAAAHAGHSRKASTSADGGRLFPKSLPHDVTFVAEMPRAHKRPGGTLTAAPPADAAATTAAAAQEEARNNYVGYFSKGLVFMGRREWRMAARMTVEAAFVMRDGRHVLVLERNLEKTLEALPLCWKVRRFGN